jgi:hypothetical protein
MEQFDKFYAIFNPKRTDNLKPNAAEFIGQKYEWEVLWVIEHGAYKGQWACGFSFKQYEKFIKDNCKNPSFTWAPEEDLDLIKEEAKYD